MKSRTLFALLLAAASAGATAITPADLQASLAAEARRSDPSFREFSAQRGAAFYRATHGGDWSCATCHTDNPAAAGSHAVTRKVVQPLAPAANPERFANPDKIDKWFKRNCNAVRYSPPKVGSGVTASVRMDLHPVIEIVDQGPGIPAQERGRVLDRFYRITGSDESGSGLGLSIAARIAALHGARLELDDGPGGKGLTVRVVFSTLSRTPGA